MGQVVERNSYRAIKMSYSNKTGYPSVTHILRPLTGCDYFRPEHAERGTRVHAACAAYAQGLFVCDLYDSEKPYLESFMKWFDSVSPTVFLVEKRMVVPSLGYCGQVDLVLEIDGMWWTVDIKTSQAKADWWRLQTAAYAELVRYNGFATKRASLRLKKNGSGCLFDEYTNKSDYSEFLKYLNEFKGETMSEEMIDFEAAIPKKAEVVDVNLPAKQDPFDKEMVTKVFDKFNSKIQTMWDDATAISVSDDDTYAQAQEMAGQAKKLKSAIDKKRVELKAPYLEFTKFLDAAAGDPVKSLDALARHIETDKMLPYAKKKEQERREAERKAIEEARLRQAELDKKAREEALRAAEEARQKALSEGKAKEEAEAQAKQAEAMVEPAPVVVPDIPQETKLTTDSMTSKIEYDYDWSISDYGLIPTEVWNERAEQVKKAIAPVVNAKIKAGIRNIPGIKVFRVEKLKTRRR